MKIKPDKIKMIAEKAVAKALDSFRRFRTTPQDIYDLSNDRYCVSSEQIASGQLGINMPQHILPAFDAFIDWDVAKFYDENDRFSPSKKESDFVWDEIDEAGEIISEALEKTPEAKKEGLTFFFETNDNYGDYQLNACLSPEDFRKKFKVHRKKTVK